MGSLIPEFQGDHEKESEIVVTIDGPSGAGKGTLGKQVAEMLNVDYYSAGDFFRSIAEDRGMSVEELSKKADRETDVEVDRRTLEKGLSENCVIESRIASWVLGDFSDLKIYVIADLEARARRIMSDLDSRETEEGGGNLEDVKERVEKRDRDNDRRYENYYGIDTSELEIYDLIIDNTELGIEEQQELVRKVLRKRFPERI